MIFPYNNAMLNTSSSHCSPHAPIAVDIAVIMKQRDTYQQRCETLEAEVMSLRQQVAWFQRQVFGQKSERRFIDTPATQGTLGFDALPESQAPVKKQTIPSHERRIRPRNVGEELSSLFFDESKVPVETIVLSHPDIANLKPEEYQLIGEKVSYRLAQRPGSYVVLKYIRPVIKRLETQTISCPPAPVGVIEGSRADVSFIAGLLIDKFRYHLPLYRQHQRLIDAGFTLSRPWLTQLVSQAIALLEPIYEAQLASIQQSLIITMDETTTKAGRIAPGKLNTGYFWPIYGDQDEICFPFFDNRRDDCVRALLGLSPAKELILLSDGYKAYENYAKATQIIHAQCWAHCRRYFFNAQKVEPRLANEALDRIGQLYDIEAEIQKQCLSPEAKHAYRMAKAEPLVTAFFDWVDQRFEQHGLLPKNPFVKALAYARRRRKALSVYLTYPDVPIDTNHLERALRVIPMGRKNWLFAWTELGAKHTGMIQSLILTCRLHDIDPYTYLIDVLQRISTHPQKDVALLTPRLWKQHFADQPLRSDLSKPLLH